MNTFILELGTETLVEVEISPKDLVGILHRKVCLDPHDLDHACHEVHGLGGADGCDIVRLRCLDEVQMALSPLRVFIHK